MYYLRSNAKEGGDTDAQSNKQKGSCCSKCGGPCVRDAHEPPQSLPIWKKRMRWPWESIRKKGKNKDTNNGDGDAGSDVRINNGLGRNEADEPSSQSQYPDGCENGENRDIFGGNEGGQGESCDGISKNDESDDISLEEKSGLCIGSIFGLDVGGTLAKLVYFQRTPQDKDEQTDDNDILPFITHHQSNPGLDDIGEGAENDEDKYARTHLNSGVMRNRLRSSLPDMSDGINSVSTRPNSSNKHLSSFLSASMPSGMKRVRSMFDVTKSKKEQKVQALDRFYTLVNRLADHDSGVKENNLSFYSPTLGGEFHFIRFETRYMTQAMKLIHAHSLHLNIEQIGATGGGAHKYANSFEENLGIQIAAKGELDSLVAGVQFVLSDFDGECYTFEPNEGVTRKHETTETHVEMPVEVTKSHIAPKQQKDSLCHEYENLSSTKKTKKLNETKEPENLKEGCPDENLWARKVKREFWTRKVKRDVVAKSESYPYMIVIIGTGVSVLRVDGLGKFERISGSTIGGGTYWGLCRLLTDVEDYESVLDLAERGKSSKVDMMVGDIYGKKVDVLEKHGLTADVVASSFGKLGGKSEPAAGLKQEDLARALLLMVTNNIGQVAYLNAQIHNTKRIYFVGNFLRHNVISQQRLAYAINYWSKGKMEALFLEHEGYLGALGAYLLHQGLQSGKVKVSKDSPSDIHNNKGGKDPGKKTRSMSM